MLTDVHGTCPDNSSVLATASFSVHLHNPPASVIMLSYPPNDPLFLLLSSTESLRIIVLADPFSGRSDRIETLERWGQQNPVVINVFLINTYAIVT